jgi:MoaA/NifB/PqqE/SkfB family radical SAM enzyme
MKKTLKELKTYLLSRFFYGSLQILSISSARFFIAYTYLAELITQRDHYKRTIRKIRGMFKEGHPALHVAMRIIRDTNPKQKKQLIKCFIINQLLVGSNKRIKFSEEEGGFYPPGLLVISPTMKCNLTCFGCYAGMYRKDNDLPFDVVDRILNEAKEMGIYFAVISGGEPFFRKDILDIFRIHNDFSFHVFTHGGLLDEKMVDRLAEMGNVLPAISVEGFREETDRRRGNGHYDSVMKAMRLMKEARLLFGYSTTLTKQNAEIVTSDEFVDHLTEQGCVLGWYFLYTPIGREPNWDLVPTPEQRNLLRERIAYFRKGKKILFGDFWNDGPIVGGCIAAGRKYLHINTKGDVEPCVFCHFARDNIKATSLRKAVTSPLFRRIQEFHRGNKNLLRPCIIIDHPHVYRDVCSMPGVYFTHEGADSIVNDLSKEIDVYAKEYGVIAEKAWKEKSKDSEEQELHPFNLF